MIALVQRSSLSQSALVSWRSIYREDWTFVGPSNHPYTHWHVCLFTHSPFHSSNCSFIHYFTHPTTYFSFIHPSIYLSFHPTCIITILLHGITNLCCVSIISVVCPQWNSEPPADLQIPDGEITVMYLEGSLARSQLMSITSSEAVLFCPWLLYRGIGFLSAPP